MQIFRTTLGRRLSSSCLDIKRLPFNECLKTLDEIK
jgi:hypothetical protein